MKSRRIQLTNNDQKAKDWVRENLEVCAHNRTLSRKLLEHSATISGSMVTIAPDWIDPQNLEAYRYTWVAPKNSPPFAVGDRPIEHVVAFVKDYLRTSDDAVLVCENHGAILKTREYWSWGPPPPLAPYGDEEVYHIFTSANADPDIIDSAMGDALGQWGTCVCSSRSHVPVGRIIDESFFDEIVLSAKHIIMPVFDNDGYLIWSPA